MCALDKHADRNARTYIYLLVMNRKSSKKPPLFFFFQTHKKTRMNGEARGRAEGEKGARAQTERRTLKIARGRKEGGAAMSGRT